MVSVETAHVIAQVYVVLSLVGSFFGVLDCAVNLSLPTESEVDDEQRKFDKLSEAARGSTPEIVVMLIANIISIGTNVMLMVGVCKKKLQLVKIYKVFTIVAIIVAVVLGIVTTAVLAGDDWWIAIILLLIGYSVVILPITALVIWILNGEIRFIEREQQREKRTMNPA